MATTDAPVSSVATTFDLYYDVRSPRGGVWPRHAGPFATLTDARDHLTKLRAQTPTTSLQAGAIIHCHITQTTTTTRVVANEED